MINRAQSEMVEALDHALASYDVSAAQYVILSTLWSGRADTAAQICKEISYTPGAMTRMIDRLEQKHLIKRSRKEENRRTNKLELTDAGKNVFPELLAASTKIINQYFGGFEAQELDLLEKLVGKMLGQS